ncbi:UDP-N-acetylmuramoyl-L-alanine--D-glutamate ligase [Erythrobacter insulae]|uniref:UDP-N-acetylmuramoylalanine--D-glutamate ligase n=1 Tax=Erythrobacter insulae TaxID=2584124 RepID=A0A547P987_9SPHN|nr:UDP-N-acetylmuramoyl-L-alanine--D-glutamate ligase [Erythrobacter insulae]TRD10708.1 UDP-N-acetylmuramoyl-L-alanine--D-glutamate ligase [Erythrobacter insulae]
MITSAVFSGKRYAVLGLARSGAATVEALLASGAEVTAWDRQDVAREPFEGRCTMADPLEMDLSGFAGVVVSPGVPLNTHPIKPHAEKFGVPVIGDIELFALARGELDDHKVIGITGTNGKSTTTALLHHILEMAGLPAVMGGNIGEPILSREPLSPNDHGAGVYVLELSSYQIDLTFNLDCDAAALTNITPDHLDRYSGFAAYASSKARLFAMQSPQRFAVFGSLHEPAGAIMRAEQGRRPNGRAVPADLARFAEMQKDWPSLQGPHNLENVAVAVALAEELGVTEPQWRHALPRFRNLPHRMELVCEEAGVLFINDSKATNPASTAPALAAFPPQADIRSYAPRVHWIVGGLAKEDGLGECEKMLGNIAAAYTVGEAGPRFAELLEGRVPKVERCELVSEAVSRAREAAAAGDVVLFSPACASFDQFRDYEKRGQHFRSLVGVIAEFGDCTPAAFDTDIAP